MADLHAVVQRHMKQRNMSLRALARAVHHDPSYISKALRGIKPLGPALACDIDRALGADGEITAAAARSPEPSADAERVRRALEDALADGMMSGGILDDWDASVDRYGYRTRDTSSPLLLADLTADLADLRLAISRHRSASALPRLALTAARMSGLVCLTLVKAGDRQAWRRWGRTARHAATEAGDRPALSWVTAQESYGYYYAGDMPGAVACAREHRTLPGCRASARCSPPHWRCVPTPRWATPPPLWPHSAPPRTSTVGCPAATSPLPHSATQKANSVSTPATRSPGSATPRRPGPYWNEPSNCARQRITPTGR
jgi:hypothetical protein